MHQNLLYIFYLTRWYIFNQLKDVIRPTLLTLKKVVVFDGKFDLLPT